MREVMCSAEATTPWGRSQPKRDSEFLQFIHARLRDAHGEPDHYDYMWRLRLIILTQQLIEAILEDDETLFDYFYR